MELIAQNSPTCPAWKTLDPVTNSCIDTVVRNDYWTLWIECTKEQLTNGQCKLNVYKTLWIRTQDQDTSVSIFVQDVLLSATSFIWTVVTLALLVSWLMYVFSWNDESLASRWKQWVKYSLIWLVIVSFSYVIVRVVQYIAKGA